MPNSDVFPVHTERLQVPLCGRYVHKNHKGMLMPYILLRKNLHCSRSIVEEIYTCFQINMLIPVFKGDVLNFDLCLLIT